MIRQMDSYFRVSPSHQAQRIAYEGSGTLTFVDVDVQESAGLLRIDDWLVDLIPSLVHSGVVLFRWPDFVTGPDLFAANEFENYSAYQVVDAAERWLTGVRGRRLRSVRGRIGALIHQLMGPPIVIFVDAEGNRDRESEADLAETASLIRRAREAEVRALMRSGRALWSPVGYHFRLPSGLHSASFIRLGDAIRSPRDGLVLASWLTEKLLPGQGFLVDNASLAPLIIQTQGLLSKAGHRVGPVAVLNDYPRTRLGVNQAARHALGPGGAISGLLSVSSSGRLCDLFAGALEAASPDSWSLDVVVDKGTIPVDGRSMDSWVRLDQADGNQVEGNEPCSLCRSPDRAKVINIDPMSFELFPLPEPERLLPDFNDARLNRSLWRLASERAAIGVVTSPAASAGPRPRYGRLGVRFFYDDLFADLVATSSAVRERAAAESLDESEQRNRKELDRLKGADWLVVSPGDAVLGGMPGAGVLRTALEALGINDDVNLCVVDPNQRNPDMSALEAAKHVVVGAVGSVTGWSMRRLAEVARGAVSQGALISGFVIHSRPVTAHDWQLTTAPFGGRCAYVWQTFLPWETPLLVEAQLLEEFQASGDAEQLSATAKAFIQGRRDVVDPADDLVEWKERLLAFEEGQLTLDPTRVLWSPADEPDREFSPLVGRDLSSIAILFSIGAGLQRSRVMSEGQLGSMWKVVDLGELVRFRFDALLLASVIRWTAAAEAWWGGSFAAARGTAEELLRAAQDRGSASVEILLGEILLAVAEGKVDPGGAEVFIRAAEGMSTIPSIEAGLALVKWARPMGT